MCWYHKAYLVIDDNFDGYGLIRIYRNGKPVAVVISMDEYESIEALKLRLLQSRVAQAMADIKAGNTVDGESFFDALEKGKHD